MKIEGQSAIVTGGGSSLGEALARALAADPLRSFTWLPRTPSAERWRGAAVASALARLDADRQ